MNKELLSRIVSLYSYGLYTHREVAELVNVHVQKAYHTYHTYKDQYNLPTVMKAVRSQITKDLKRARHLYDSGYTLEQVAIEYNITRERVRQVFAAHGMKMRTTGRPKNATCPEGHPLKKGEYDHTCPDCRQLKKEQREMGLHLKTHCKWGHPLAGSNLLYFSYAKGKYGRRCKTCCYEKMKIYKQGKKQKGE